MNYYRASTDDNALTEADTWPQICARADIGVVTHAHPSRQMCARPKADVISQDAIMAYGGA